MWLLMKKTVTLFKGSQREYGTAANLAHAENEIKLAAMNDITNFCVNFCSSLDKKELTN